MSNLFEAACDVQDVTAILVANAAPSVIPSSPRLELEQPSLNHDSSDNALPISDVPLAICFGGDCFDKNPKQIPDFTFNSLVDTFSEPDTSRGRLSLAEYLALDKTKPDESKLRDSEKNGLYFIPARFSREGTRLAADVTALSCFVIDIDSGTISRQLIEDRLRGLTYLAYSSYSHHPDHPRWRVVIPYAKEISPDKHNPVYEHFQKLFNGTIDNRCETVNQIWYTPACPFDAEEHFQFFRGEGQLFDAGSVNALPLAIFEKKSHLTVSFATNDVQLTRVNSAIRAISPHERNTWVKIGLALFHAYGQRCRDLWLEWSRESSKFELDEAVATWNSFRSLPAGEEKVGLGTIFHTAKESGWVDADNIPSHIDAFNENHFVAFDGKSALVHIEHRDDEKGLPEIKSISFKAFQDYYRNKNIEFSTEAGSTKLNIAKSWLGHPHRRTYKGLVFKPGGKAPEGYYNLWQGFAYPAIQGNWSKYQEHMLKVICSGNLKCYEYLLNWMAYAIQYPDRPGHVAIILRGERGTGKGTFISTFMELFGSHGMQISSSKYLVGHFNEHLRDCVLLFADEAFYAGDKQGESTLKALVTEKNLTIEPKGCDAFKAQNYLHIMMASNSDWVIPAGPHERRFFVLDVSAQHIQERAYFEPIHNQMYKEGGLEAMMYDLLHRDISNFYVAEIPETNALDEQVLRSMTREQTWWMDTLDKSYTVTDWLRQSREDMQTSFSKAVSTNYDKGAATKLGMFFKKALPPGFPKKVRCTTRNSPHTQIDCYEFPPQDICKSFFVKLLGLTKDPWK